MKTVFIICLFVYIVCGNEEDLRIIDSIMQEEPCLSQGGLCTIATDCPQGNLIKKPDLCPTQRKQGVECCYGLSLKETRCEKHGGICMEQSDMCNPKLVFEATDCKSDQKCCILI